MIYLRALDQAPTFHESLLRRTPANRDTFSRVGA